VVVDKAEDEGSHSEEEFEDGEGGEDCEDGGRGAEGGILGLLPERFIRNEDVWLARSKGAYVTPLPECDIHAQQAQEEAEAGGGVAHMAGVKVEVCGYAVQGEVVLLGRNLPDLWALEVNIGDYAADEAELDNAKAAKEEAGRKESPECGWRHGCRL
jgi:hypothetical protein